jgi:formate dehydrogenase major subunit
VATDFIHNDTTDFWKSGILDSGKIKTEVFLLPGLSLLEKQGTITASDRWTTWIEPVGRFKGEAQSELWIIDHIFQSVKSVYKVDGVLPEPIQYASWNTGNADPDTVLDEMSGQNLATGRPVSAVSELLADGNTVCGNILYCGINKTKNLLRRRKNDRGYSSAGIYPSWGWSIPSNVRILYNRAALDKKGAPLNEQRTVASADGSFRASDRIHGEGAVGIHPFIMNRDGVGYLLASDLAEEAFPFFAFENPLMKKAPADSSRVHALCSAFSYYNLSRISPLVNESSLSGACELSKDLAAEKKIKNGDRVRVTSRTGSAFFTAVISSRGKKSSSEWIGLRGEGARALFLPLPFEHTIVPVDIAPAPLKEEKKR